MAGSVLPGFGFCSWGGSQQNTTRDPFTYDKYNSPYFTSSLCDYI